MDGGCYCGAVRYRVEARPRLMAQCHCRACQHVSGGGPNYYMLIPPEGFRYVAGAPKRFARPDLENAVTREFCGACGTQLTTRRPGLADVILKVGTLDDPSIFTPRIAIFVAERAAVPRDPRGDAGVPDPAGRLKR